MKSCSTHIIHHRVSCFSVGRFAQQDQETEEWWSGGGRRGRAGGAWFIVAGVTGASHIPPRAPPTHRPARPEHRASPADNPSDPRHAAPSLPSAARSDLPVENNSDSLSVSLSLSLSLWQLFSVCRCLCLFLSLYSVCVLVFLFSHTWCVSPRTALSLCLSASLPPSLSVSLHPSLLPFPSPASAARPLSSGGRDWPLSFR